MFTTVKTWNQTGLLDKTICFSGLKNRKSLLIDMLDVRYDGDDLLVTFQAYGDECLILKRWI